MSRHSEATFDGGGVSFSGGVGVLSLDRALPGRNTRFGRAPAVVPEAGAFHITALPDLGVDIGSRAWWRGAAACAALCALTFTLAPRLQPLTPLALPLPPVAAEESRAQSIAPLAWGADTGKHMGATDAVQPLTDTPERPQIDLTATVGQGDGFQRALQRAGVSADDTARVVGLIGDVADPDAIAPGTALAITLGRRANRTQPRPLVALALHPRLDMKVAFVRIGSALTMQRIPVAVDFTPLRVEGRVGDSLYASARAAGATGDAAQAYIRAVAPKVSMDDISADDRFDLIVEQARAATGEVQYGKLLYAGLARGDRALRMIQWTVDGHEAWYDAAGVGERRAGFVMPVAGAHKTSGFGMRMHPLLGYSRMHQGVDYGAGYGTPIRAVTGGLVSFAGWHGGHGNMVKLSHAGGLGTGYAHMSHIAVAPGTRVAQGQVIGFVGSTGLSTGPHLHFEVYRSGVPVSPGSVSFADTPLLSGAELAAFRTRMSEILALRPARVQIASR